MRYIVFRNNFKNAFGVILQKSPDDQPEPEIVCSLCGFLLYCVFLVGKV